VPHRRLMRLLKFFVIVDSRTKNRIIVRRLMFSWLLELLTNETENANGSFDVIEHVPCVPKWYPGTVLYVARGALLLGPTCRP